MLTTSALILSNAFEAEKEVKFNALSLTFRSQDQAATER